MAPLLMVGKFNTDVDMNHPVAGKNLHFQVEILNIRNATSTEISHGHAHAHGEQGCYR